MLIILFCVDDDGVEDLAVWILLRTGGEGRWSQQWRWNDAAVRSDSTINRGPGEVVSSQRRPYSLARWDFVICSWEAKGGKRDGAFRRQPIAGMWLAKGKPSRSLPSLLVSCKAPALGAVRPAAEGRPASRPPTTSSINDQRPRALAVSIVAFLIGPALDSYSHDHHCS